MFIGKWDVERKEDFLYEGSCRIHKVDGISVWFFGVLYNKKTLGYDPAANEAKIIIEIYREKGYTGFARLDGSFTCLLRTPDYSGTIMVHLIRFIIRVNIFPPRLCV